MIPHHQRLLGRPGAPGCPITRAFPAWDIPEFCFCGCPCRARPPPGFLRSKGPVHFGGVLLGHGTSPVLVLLVSQAQLPSTEACFLSPAPIRSFAFTARFGKRGSEGKTPAHTKRSLVWGLGREPWVRCQMPDLPLPASRAQARRVPSSLKSEWLEGEEKVVRGAELQPVAKSGPALLVPTVCRNSVSVLLGSSGSFPSSRRPPCSPQGGGQGCTSDFGCSFLSEPWLSGSRLVLGLSSAGSTRAGGFWHGNIQFRSEVPVQGWEGDHTYYLGL